MLTLGTAHCLLAGTVASLSHAHGTPGSVLPRASKGSAQPLVLNGVTGSSIRGTAAGPLHGPLGVVGRWSKPPTRVPSSGATDGALFGNGEVAVIFGGQPDGFSFNFGMNSFVRATSDGGRSVIAAPGGVDIHAPAFHNASYNAAQIIDNGTVTSSFYRQSVGTLSSSSFVAPMQDGVNLMVTQLQFEAEKGGQDKRPPQVVELGVAARAGPLGKADDFLVWGPCSIVGDGSSGSILVANRSNGEDWQDIYSTGRPPTEDSFGHGIARVAIAVSAAFTTPGSQNAFANVSVPKAGVDVGRSANGTVQLPAGHTLILLAAVASSVNLHKDGAADASIRYGDPVAAVVQTLRAARRQLSKTIHYAQTANHHMWQRYWQKSSISLPNSPLIERYWWSSLYLLRLAAGGSTPPGLYGPFITQDDCEWAGDLHLNYNYQATYYGVLQAGHEELIEAYFKPLLSYRKWARIWAQHLFGCRGLAFPTGIGQFGNPSDGGGWKDNGQRSNGLFAALHFSSTWWYLRPPMGVCNQTKMESKAAADANNHLAKQGFASELGPQLLDYTSETLDFWLDYLVKHYHDNGTSNESSYEYRILNDCFMELCGVPDGRGNYATNVPNINNHLTVAYLRYHLKTLISMAAAANSNAGPDVADAGQHISSAAVPERCQLPVPQQRLAQWKDILSHLPPLATTVANLSRTDCHPNQAWSADPSQRCRQCRWLWNGTDDGCEHTPVKIYAGVLGAGPSAPGSNPVETSAIFPGSNAIGLSSPVEELHLARSTVVYLDSWVQGNAFAQIFSAAGRVFAGNETIPSLRVGEDYLMRTFERVINGSMNGMGGNLWLREFGGGVETLGGLAYIAESLLQSHEGFLRFFPGLPPTETASFTGLRAQGAIVVNASRAADGSVYGVRVRSEQGLNVSVLNPSGDHVSVVNAEGKVVAVTPRDVGNGGLVVWDFVTERQTDYILNLG